MSGGTPAKETKVQVALGIGYRPGAALRRPYSDQWVEVLKKHEAPAVGALIFR